QGKWFDRHNWNINQIVTFSIDITVNFIFAHWAIHADGGPAIEHTEKLHPVDAQLTRSLCDRQPQCGQHIFAQRFTGGGHGGHC
ncbi:MAG: hypothetical protein ACRC8Q_12660, partial [Aeromonas sp.]